MIRHGLAALALVLAMSGAALAAPLEARIGLPREPVSLDPSTSADPATGWIAYGNIFETLTGVDAEGAVRPVLATSWKFSIDGLELNLEIRPGVRFHDGTDLDAGDVKFSLDRSIGKPGLSNITGVRVTGPLTVMIDLGKPDDGIVKALASNIAVIIAPESADNNATAPIGTGPYALSDWSTGERIVLERNDDYWGADVTSAAHPQTPKVMFVFPGAPEAVALLEAGQLDGMAQVEDFSPYEGLRANPKLQFVGKGLWKAGITGMPGPLVTDRVEAGMLKWPQ